jgi:hypothetical protein
VATGRQDFENRSEGVIHTSKTNNPSAHIKRRSATMEVEQIAPNAFRVAPPEKGKKPRIVKFLMDIGDMAIDCFDEKSKRDCPANSCARHCSHVEAAIRYLLKITGESNA